MALPAPNSPKMLFHVPAFALALIGFFLLAAALLTPAWQVVYARELRQWVQSGLWISCQTRPTGMYTCTYTFTQNDFDFYTSAEVVNIRTPAFYQWQRSLLHVLLGVQLCALLALISFCVASHPPAEKAAAATFSAAMALGAVVCLGCMVAFSVFAHMVEYRFFHVSVSGIYEKHVGYSFYLGIAAGICFLLSLFFSLAYLAKILATSSQRSSSEYSYNPRLDYRMATAGDLPYSDEDFFAMRALPQVPRKH